MSEDFNINSNNFTNVREDDKYDKIAKLKKLLDSKAISLEEYSSEKEKLLKL